MHTEYFVVLRIFKKMCIFFFLSELFLFLLPLRVSPPLQPSLSCRWSCWFCASSLHFYSSAVKTQRSTGPCCPTVGLIFQDSLLQASVVSLTRFLTPVSYQFWSWRWTGLWVSSPWAVWRNTIRVKVSPGKRMEPWRHRREICTWCSWWRVWEGATTPATVKMARSSIILSSWFIRRTPTADGFLWKGKKVQTWRQKSYAILT